MRPFSTLLIAGGLLLAGTVPARAQSGMMSQFGGYPNGGTAASLANSYWSGFYGLNPGGAPIVPNYQPYNPNFTDANYNMMRPGAGAMNPNAPGTTTYSSGYVAPGTTGVYGNGYRPGYSTNYPFTSYGYGTPYGSYRQSYGTYRGGFFGGRR